VGAMDSECMHLEVLEDFAYGVEVCTSCGLVLSNQIYLPEIPINNNDVNYSNKSNLMNSVNDICDNLNMPMSIQWMVCDFFKRHFEEMQLIKKVNRDDFLSFSIYYVLKIEGFPRTMKNISEWTGTSQKKIWRIEKLLFPGKLRQLESSNILDPICANLELTYNDIQNIKNIICGMAKSNFNPNVVAASEVYKYCKSIKIPNTTMKSIAVLFDINPISIFRYCKKRK
jgi:transcription initiation factor TFIIIB Brf1 subunit/transcription initiation factor TFIIB